MPDILPRPPGGGWFKAQYEGKCRGCGAPIYVGEWIKYSQDQVVCCRPCIAREEGTDE
jgi:hypothetical protein